MTSTNNRSLDELTNTAHTLWQDNSEEKSINLVEYEGRTPQAPDFTREQPIHPKVPEKPNFIVILNAWNWNPNYSL